MIVAVGKYIGPNSQDIALNFFDVKPACVNFRC
jgi:hypothetical protein